MPVKRKRGRPPAGTTLISLRLPKDLLGAIDEHRKKLPGRVTRQELIRRLLTGDLLLSDAARATMNAADADLSDCIVTSENFLDAAAAVRIGAAKIVDCDGEEGYVEEMYLVPIDWNPPPWRLPENHKNYSPPPPRWERVISFGGFIIEQNAAAYPSAVNRRFRYRSPDETEWSDGLPDRMDFRIAEQAFRDVRVR